MDFAAEFPAAAPGDDPGEWPTARRPAVYPAKVISAARRPIAVPPPPVVPVAPQVGERRRGGSERDPLAACASRALRGDAAAIAELTVALAPSILTIARAAWGPGLGAHDAAPARPHSDHGVDLLSQLLVDGVRGLGPHHGRRRGVRQRATIAAARSALTARRQLRRSSALCPSGSTDQPAMRRAELRDFMDTLPPHQAEVVLLRVILGLGLPEASAVVGASSGTVRGRLRSAKDKLLRHATRFPALSRCLPADPPVRSAGIGASGGSRGQTFDIGRVLMGDFARDLGPRPHDVTLLAQAADRAAKLLLNEVGSVTRRLSAAGSSPTWPGIATSNRAPVASPGGDRRRTNSLWVLPFAAAMVAMLGVGAAAAWLATSVAAGSTIAGAGARLPAALTGPGGGAPSVVRPPRPPPPVARPSADPGERAGALAPDPGPRSAGRERDVAASRPDDALPSEPARILVRAQALIDRGRGRHAAGLLRDLQEQHPDAPEALRSHLVLGDIYLASGASARARRQFDRYLSRVGPGSEGAAIALHGLARAHEGAGDAVAARAAWRQLATAYPDRPEARAAREALSRAAMGRLAEDWEGPGTSGGSSSRGSGPAVH